MADTARPDDALGIGFRRIITVLRAAARSWLAWSGSSERQSASIVWKTTPHLPGSDFDEEHTAIVGECRLYAVQMSDAFLKKDIDCAPKISWSVWLDRPDVQEVGGPAPSMEEAVARAEAAFRAATGALNN